MEKNEKVLTKEQKGKTPFSILRKGAIAGLLGLTMCVGCLGFSGCSDGKDGQNGRNGSQWYSGTANIETITMGDNGDFYYDTDDYKLYQKENDNWVLKMDNFGKPGTNGQDGQNGQNGQTPTITINADGYWVINGVPTDVKAKGENGQDGQDGQNGQDGQTPTITINADGYWVINGVATEVKAKGENGTSGANGSTILFGTTAPTADQGKNGDMFLNKTNFDVYEKSNGEWNLIGNIKGDKGDQGEEGESLYVGYDGYIWQGTERTEYKASIDSTTEKNIVENTIGVFTTMKCFDGEFIDLSSNTIALMANFKPNAQVTQYSGTKAIEIQVVADEAGTLQIGTAKVSEIVKARTTGVSYSSSTTSYNLTAGQNTITLDMDIAENETIVLGGNNSTAKLYVAKNIPVSDEVGNFSLINAESNDTIISKTNNFDDTLAIRVKAVVLGQTTEVAIFPNLLNDFPESKISDDSVVSVAGTTNSPYIMLDNTLLMGETITKIGVPVKANNASSGQKPFITVYKVKAQGTYSTSNTILHNIIGEPIKLYFPEDTKANTWAYAQCNIELGDDETLAWGAQGSTDTLSWGFSQNTSNGFITNIGTSYSNMSLIFDIYTKTSSVNSFSKHLENIQQKELETTLTNFLKNNRKTNLSILGDSISTYIGYSNDNTTTNDTIGSNATYYGVSGKNTELTVNDTWWKQTANATGLNILVNNSCSGDKVTALGISRCEQLHDNTGENAGTNPDIIAVYLGINDFNANTNCDVFKTTYESMLKKIIAKYSNADNETGADIFVFTLVPNKSRIAESNLLEYNDIIRELAKTYNCGVVDLYENSGINASNNSTYMSDTIALHPNALGMDMITDCFIETMYNYYLSNK